MDKYQIIETIRKYANYYKNGAMDKKTAEACASIYIKEYNQIAKKIATKHGVAPRIIKFSDFTR